MSAAGDRCRVKSPHYKNERGESMCSCHLKKGHKGHHAAFSPSSGGVHQWGAESFDADSLPKGHHGWINENTSYRKGGSAGTYNIYENGKYRTSVGVSDFKKMVIAQSRFKKDWKGVETEGPDGEWPKTYERKGAESFEAPYPHTHQRMQMDRKNQWLRDENPHEVVPSHRLNKGDKIIYNGEIHTVEEIEEVVKRGWLFKGPRWKVHLVSGRIIPIMSRITPAYRILDAESFEAEDKKKPTTNLRAIRRRRKLKALGFKRDAESFEAENPIVAFRYKDDSPAHVCRGRGYTDTTRCGQNVNWDRIHYPYHLNESTIVETLGSIDYEGRITFGPSARKRICLRCYRSAAQDFDAESFGADEQKETPQKWLQRKMKPYRMDRLQRRAESGPIVIDGYMPKRVEVFSDTVLFYIGDMAEMRYGHPEVQRKLLGDISIIDPNGIRKEDVEKILKREWDGRFFLFEEGGTFVGDERTYGSEQFEAVYCSKCKRMGYSDQMGKDNGGYLCTRCSRPDIDWVAHDKKYGASRSHRYYKPPVKEDKDSITMRYLKKRSQIRGQRDGETFSWLIIGLGVVFILGANKIVVGK